MLRKHIFIKNIDWTKSERLARMPEVDLLGDVLCVKKKKKEIWSDNQ